MKGKRLLAASLALCLCLCLCACSSRDVDVAESSGSLVPSSQTEEPLMEEPLNESEASEPSAEVSLPSSTDVPEESEGTEQNSEEQASDTSEEEYREEDQVFKQLEIDVPVIGADMEQSKRLVFFCPPDWESFYGDINRENKKLVDLICTTPERTEDRLASIDNKKEIVIGERTFQVYSEEYGILENEPQKQVVPYVIWRYYYFDGELYYRFDFYQNQQTMPITLEEFESVLATMEIHDVEA